MQVKEHDPEKHWKPMKSKAFKNKVNAFIGETTMLLIPHAHKTLNSIEGIIHTQFY